MGALKAMFSFFTMIRLDITQEDMDAMDKKFWIVPVIGAFYGLIAALLMTAFAQLRFVSPLAASVITFFVIFAMNRFLHIDGTIDVGDGLVVAGTKEDHLRALKDSRIGAGGMAFALMIILMSVVFAAAVPLLFITFLIFCAEVLAKVGMVSAAAFGTAGDGMAGNSVRNTNATSLLFAAILAIIFIVLFGLFVYALDEYTTIRAALPYDTLLPILAIFIVPLLVAVLTGIVMSSVAKSNFGMVNGDVLGATNEITRAAVLLTFLILISVI